MNVTFSEQLYTIGEGGGQVEICLAVIGITMRSITITVTTAPATASGMNYVGVFVYKHVFMLYEWYISAV